jgi:glucose/arabinose dehydrogenase
MSSNYIPGQLVGSTQFAQPLESPVVPTNDLSNPQTIAFVDPKVADATSLMTSLDADIKVLLDPTRDGISQITEALGKYQGLTGVSVLSHGDIAQLELGNSQLSAGSLQEYGSQLQQWKSALTPGADLLFYACNVAQGDSGKAFIDNLGNLVGVDIAASTNSTGAGAQGGDWKLEYSTGSIETATPLSADAIDSYNGILGPVFLSDLTPTTVASNGWGPLELNKSNGESAANDGVTMTLNGVSYARGLGVHATSDITYNLVGGNYTRFTSDIGVDDEVGSNGSVVFQVWADGVQIYDSGIMTGSSATKTVDVDVTGRQNLRLQVLNGGDNGWYDHADWANAQLFSPSSGPASGPSLIVVGNNSLQVTEGNTVTIPIRRQGDSSGTATVDYRIGGNATAVAGVNYTEIPPGTLTFAPGETEKTVTLQTLDDNVTNTNVSVSLLVQGAVGADLGPSRTAAISIRDKASPSPSARTYLSDLTPTSATSAWGPIERDRSNGEAAAGDGNVLSLGGTPYNKGIGVHADSQLTYNLGGAYSNFSTYVGVDDEVGANGSVVFQILADGVPLFDSGIMTGTSSTRLARVDVTGRQTLTLVVNNGGDGIAYDHADWAEAQLDGGPLTQPPSTSIVPEDVITGLNRPTALDWSPDGQLMFIAQKDGVVRTFAQGSGGSPTNPGSQLLPVQRYATGTHSHGITSADFNGDGRLDIATANAGSNNISVLLGNGTGTFAPTTNFGVGVEPKSVFAADFNRDGRIDLFTANQVTNDVSVLLGNGDGTFAPSVSYAGVPNAHEAVAADVDGDSDIDIAVAGWGSNTIRIMRNNGDGTFANFTDYSVDAEARQHHSLQLADFNGDGRPDIAVTSYDTASISVLLNTGSGAFGSSTRYTVGSNPHSIRAGDLNGDGRIDLATANEGDNTVGVLIGNGNGTFAPVVNYATGSVPKGVAIGDLNGDSRADLATANTAGNYPNQDNPGGNTISLLTGRGDGTFTAPTAYTTGRTPFSLNIADFNGDGRSDIASANWHTGDAGVLLNSAQVTPPTPTGVAPGLQPTPFIDLRSQVNDWKDRGLLGMAVDPGLGRNQGRDFVYLLFTYDPPETQANPGQLDGPDGNGNRPVRLIRVTANSATNYTTALPGSEVVLLGKNSLWQYTSGTNYDSDVGTNSGADLSILASGIANGSNVNPPSALIEDPDTANLGRDYLQADTDFDRNNNIRDYIAMDSPSHSGGQLKFAPDGSLYITSGDGVSYNNPDERANRVQDVDNLSGKLLRINPLTGQGYADNPFANGDLDSNRSKVWSLGIRNSFRFTISPDGTPYIGDVGWNTWEEINVVAKGANYGWPYYEGPAPNSAYTSLPQAQAFFNSGQQTVAPLITRSHIASQNPDNKPATALIMGDFYTGNTLPAAYNGALIYNDAGGGMVYATFLNPDGTVRSTQEIGNLPYIVNMEMGPDGYLYYASLYGNAVGRWRSA